MRRELFIYWRADAAVADNAVLAVQEFHSQLVAARPDIHPRLYRRSDASGGAVTLMETYTSAAGLDDTWQADVLRAASAALASWAREGRHVEVFDCLAGRSSAEPSEREAHLDVR